MLAAASLAPVPAHEGGRIGVEGAAATTFTIVTAQGTETIAHYHGCRGFAREVGLLAPEASLDRRLRVPSSTVRPR